MSFLTAIVFCVASYYPAFSQTADEHDSTYNLFKDLEYQNIDYLQNPDWHGFWHREWDGYRFNHKSFNNKRVFPGQCDVSKDSLDCSTMSQSETLVEINKAPIVKITSESFPTSNSVEILRLISLPNLIVIEDGVFDRLVHLQQIVIVGTAVEQIPQFSKKMESLELVDMYNNALKIVPDETFKNCPKLTTVNLGQNDINYVSTSAFHGSKLQYLTLHHNALTYVPSIVGTEIIYLGLEYNNIAAVGNFSLMPMDSLIHLNLSYNPIIHFEHDCFNALPDLKFLELLGLTEEIEIPFHFFRSAQAIEHVTMDYSNKLSFSGRAVEVVPSLQGLSARYCKITGIDFRAIQGSNSLKRLWLDGNELTSVQHSMFIHGNFASLEELYLNHNQIVDVEWFTDPEYIDRTLIVKRSMKFFNDTSFKLMPVLRILNFEENLIREIRNNTFIDLPRLEELYLSKNILDDDSIQIDAFKGLEKLKILMLEKNLLKSVPYAVYSLKGLVRLNMRENKLTFISSGDFTSLQKLQWLDLSSNRILLVENKAFPPSIIYLWLSSNELNFYDTEIFHELSNLRSLRLDFNHISYLPENIFSRNNALWSIHLNNNYLRFVNSSHFANNEQLSGNILLNNNQIAFIGEGTFAHIKSAENIWLQSNELYDLPNDGMFQDVDVSGEIRIDYNRLTVLKPNTFSNIRCSYFKINNNDITEIYGNAFQNITVTKNEDNEDLLTFDISENPIRKLHSYAFNEISVGNRAKFTNLKPLKVIPTFALNNFSARSIDFSDNQLDMIQMKAFNDISIKEGLLLSDTGLKWIDRMAIIGSVGKLFLQNNIIERIPDSALSYVTKNSKLHLQNNELVVIESNALPNSKEEILLQNNSISLLSENMFANNGRTKFLSLKSNKIKRLEADIFTGMDLLEGLDLSENAFNEIPDNLFSGLRTLESLNLMDNSIRHFGSQTGLESLQEINMENNLLAGVDSRVLESTTPLKRFRLKANKLSCGCSLFSALTPVKESVQGAACTNPPHLTDVKLNWGDKDHSRYFTAVPTDSYVCEPINVSTRKVDETTFMLSWDPPEKIQYQGSNTNNYCFTDACPGTQISYDIHCEDPNGGTVLSKSQQTINSLMITHDANLPYYCWVLLNRHTSSGVITSSWSEVVSYKRDIPPPDSLQCEDGTRCYQLTAEYFKMSRDVLLFNNYGPERAVSSPKYRRTLILNYLYGENPQSLEDEFVSWYGPTEHKNVRTKQTLFLPTPITNGYRLFSSRFFPVPDAFHQSARDCDYNVRPLGFTGKLYSSVYRTGSEVLKLGAVDEGWVYFGGQLLVEIVAPEGDSEEVCTEVVFGEREARVWTGVIMNGDCTVSFI